MKDFLLLTAAKIPDISRLYKPNAFILLLLSAGQACPRSGWSFLAMSAEVLS